MNRPRGDAAQRRRTRASIANRNTLIGAVPLDQRRQDRATRDRAGYMPRRRRPRATASTLVSVVLGDAERGARATPTRWRCCSYGLDALPHVVTAARDAASVLGRASQVARARRHATSPSSRRARCASSSRRGERATLTADRRCPSEIEGPLPRGTRVGDARGRACAAASSTACRSITGARSRARASGRRDDRGSAPVRWPCCCSLGAVVGRSR